MSNSRKLLVAALLFLAGYLTMNLPRCDRGGAGTQVQQPAR